MAQSGKLESLWMASTPGTNGRSLPGPLSVDVAVVGAGISGLTAALLLARQGKQVAVLDMHRVGAGETGYTTAHLTVAWDAGYKDLVTKFGDQAARLAARAAKESIDRIETFITEENLRCGFRRLPAYVFAEKREELPDLQLEAEVAHRLGLDVQLTDDVPLPFETAGALRFEDQGQFHPREYLLGLAAAFQKAGGKIYEQTRVMNVHQGDPCTVETDLGDVQAKDVLVTANVPINNKFFLHAKLIPQRSYVVAARVDLPVDGLFYDRATPYHYVRSAEIRGETFLIVGGEDHKVGSERDTSVHYEALEKWTRQRFPIASLDYRWSGQIIEPADGLPYIGLNSVSRHVYVATGYSGTGMTGGTIAGELLAKQVLGESSSYTRLFDATRTHPSASAGQVLKENYEYAKHIVKDRLSPPEARRIDDVARDEGRIVLVDGKKQAVYRAADGRVTALSPVCPHMGCHVAWNGAEKTWDCPCHGSRFSCEGKILNGPATADLRPATGREEEPPEG